MNRKEKRKEIYKKVKTVLYNNQKYIIIYVVIVHSLSIIKTMQNI